MANQPQPHNPANPPNVGAPATPGVHPAAPTPVAPGDAAPTPFPGGMASDPAVALANEIMTNIKGAPDRFRSQVDNTPALKALMEQSNNDLISGISQSIRNLVNQEVARVTGGMAPPKQATTAEKKTA
jgi:hypothetical protein